MPTIRAQLAFAVVCLAVVSASVGGCTEPECPPGKVLVGKACLRTSRAADGGLSGGPEEGEVSREGGDAGGVMRDGGSETMDGGASLPPDASVDAALDQAPEDGQVDSGLPCLPVAETCDGADNDCDSRVDEHVSEAPIGESCSNGAQGVCGMTGTKGCFAGATVCSAPTASTPQKEKCDGLDNDCNGKADDGAVNLCGGTDCGLDGSKLGMPCAVGEGDCQNTGRWECDANAGNNKLRCSVSEKPKTCATTGSCAPLPPENCATPQDDNCNGLINEGCCIVSTEVCDGVDNNCNGIVDDVTQAWYRDCDGDGYAAAGTPVMGACNAPKVEQGCSAWTLRVPNGVANTDCDDARASHNPGITTPGYTGGGSGDLNCDGRTTVVPELVLLGYALGDPAGVLAGCGTWDFTMGNPSKCCWTEFLMSTTGRVCSATDTGEKTVYQAVTGYVPHVYGGAGCALGNTAAVLQPCL